ncbi:lipopolysaccharide biosynthesis protein [Oricola indica]|uniref:lipopolysaccharide biosynthesis protein n=1 Tax=Oricola indica TaxID=2872591 RepID=UPI001CBE2E19|nr:lipopolysaccharide biosynthesis protein [Oricola indica]
MIWKKRVLGAVIWSAVEQVGGQGVSTIFLLAFARILTPEDFGIFSAGALLAGFAAKIGVFGLDTVIVQKTKLDEREFSTAVWTTLLISVALGFALSVSAAQLAWVFGEPRITGIIPLLAIGTVATSLTATLTGALRRDLRMKSLAKRTLIANLLSGLVALPFVLSGFGYWALVVQMVGGAVLTLALTYVMLEWSIRIGFDIKAAREMLTFGASITGADLLTHYNRESPKMFVGLFLGVDALGIFSMGMRVMNLLLQVVGVALTKVTLPVLAEVNRSSPKRLKEIFLRIVRLGGAAIVPIFLLTIVLRDSLVEVVLGRQWETVAPILAFLGGAGLLTALNYINGSTIVAIGQPSARLWFSSFRAAIGTILLVAATPLGVVYAAAALFVRGLIVEPMQLGYLLRKLGANNLDYLRSLRGILLGAIALVIVASACVALLSSWTATALLVAAVTVSTAFFIAVLLLADREFAPELSALKS